MALLTICAKVSGILQRHAAVMPEPGNDIQAFRPSRGEEDSTRHSHSSSWSSAGHGSDGGRTRPSKSSTISASSSSSNSNNDDHQIHQVLPLLQQSQVFPYSSNCSYRPDQLQDQDMKSSTGAGACQHKKYKFLSSSIDDLLETVHQEIARIPVEAGGDTNRHESQ